MNPALIETLRLAQRLGFFGDGAIERAVVHAEGFVAAIGELPDRARIADLGSGGGLPGLVLAEHFREAAILLVDRRRKRTDFLERAVRRLGYPHVAVFFGDAEMVGREVASGQRQPFDVVTARGFGPPLVTLSIAAALVAPDGRIVISEPPHGERWDAALLDRLGLRGTRVGGVRVFERFT